MNARRFRNIQNTMTQRAGHCSADLPEFHADGALQLNESRLQMHRLALRVVEVDGTLLVLVLRYVTEMRAQLQPDNRHQCNNTTDILTLLSLTCGHADCRRFVFKSLQITVVLVTEIIT